MLDRVQRRQLKWYGQLVRMDDIRWQKIYRWTSDGRRRKGRPQSWKNQATDFIRNIDMEDVTGELDVIGVRE